MQDVINCQNLSCPQPLLKVRSHIQGHSPERFTVIVDNPAACENVTRFAQGQGYAMTRKQEGGLWRLEATRVGPATVQAHQAVGAACSMAEMEKILVIVASEFYGTGDDVLGGRLVTNFLNTLPEMGESLWRVILLNGAVKLAVTGSPALQALQTLKESGVDVLVCTTCLDFFHLMDQQAVGETTNMLDVVTSMQVADKVLQI